MLRKPQPHPGPDPDDATIDADIDPEYEWRVLMLEQAGFDHFIAFRLSVCGADWHDAARMLREGAGQQQILDILS